MSIFVQCDRERCLASSSQEQLPFPQEKLPGHHWRRANRVQPGKLGGAAGTVHENAIRNSSLQGKIRFHCAPQTTLDDKQGVTLLNHSLSFDREGDIGVARQEVCGECYRNRTDLLEWGT